MLGILSQSQLRNQHPPGPTPAAFSLLQVKAASLLVVTPAEVPSHWLGISMTPALWLLVAIQAPIVLLAFGLCFVEVRDRLAAKRIARFGVAALLISVALSVFTYLSALVLSFAVDGPPSEQAEQLATHLLTMMHARWMGPVFAILLGLSLKVQDARGRALPTA